MREKNRSGPKVGLALGGGAARGLAHIGVLQVLEEQGVQVHAIAGTSMGAIVGAIYLMEENASRLVKRMQEFLESEAFKAGRFDVLREQRNDEDDNWFDSMAGMIRRGWAYTRTLRNQSVIDREVFENIINELVPDVNIEDLPRPFAAVSLNVVDGKEVIWTKGSLRNALWATSAIPGFFPPLELNGMILVDGAWTNSVPVEPAIALGAERVIAVDISREVEEMMEYKRGVNLILRSAILTSKHLRERQLREADLVIRPAVGEIHWADFENPDALIQKGHNAALLHLDQIKSLHQPSPPWARFYLRKRFRKMVEQLAARKGESAV